MFPHPDKPATPTLTSDAPDSPTEGDTITLTCSTNSSSVSSYRFLLGYVIVQENNSSTYVIRDAEIGTDEGKYTCRTQASNQQWSHDSVPLPIECKFV